LLSTTIIKYPKSIIKVNAKRVIASLLDKYAILSLNKTDPKENNKARAKNAKNNTPSAKNAHTRLNIPRLFLAKMPYKESPSFDIWFNRVVQDIITDNTKKTVVPLVALSAVDAIACPVSLNSSGNLDTKSSVILTPNTPNAVNIKKAIGTTDVRKKNTHAPATVVSRFLFR
jgi:hypothetical protein